MRSILEGEAEEASGRHLETPPDIQEAPRRHPGNTQQPPKGTKGSRKVFEVNSIKTIVFYSKKWRGYLFGVRVAKATCTKSAACAQKLAGARARAESALTPPSL